MFRTLIVPLDGSELAERALPYAVQLAAASGARLALVRSTAIAREDAEEYLRQCAESIAPRVEVITAMPGDDPATSILEQADQFHADAIVMATRGRTGLGHLLQGSVAESVLAHSRVPVLLVYARPGDDAAPPPFDPTTARILVPLDGSTFSEAAVYVARQMLGIAGELLLTTVARPPEHVERDESGHVRAYLDQQEESLTREAHAYLHQVIGELKVGDPDLHVTLDVRIGEPAEGIVAVEADRTADLVVMSTHGRTGVGRALMGSVAGEVLRSGRTPVMLVGPAAPRAIASLTRRAVTAGG
jgi:nucleotide-binding universal stress UspA family protein